MTGAANHREVVIDVTRLVGRALKGWIPTGIDRVMLAYIEKYGADARALIRIGGRWSIPDARVSRAVFGALSAPGMRIPPGILLQLSRHYVTGGTVSPGATLIHAGHDGLHSAAYAKEVRRRQLKAYFFLHDIIPITHPEFCRAGEAERHRRRVETMVTAGNGLIVNSAATRDEVEFYAARNGWRLPPCIVAPLAAGKLQQPAANPLMDEPYFVILGTIEPRKNHLFLLHLWRSLVAETKGAAPKLVVIGQRGWECEQAVDMLDRCDALKGVVIERPRCSDTELATWLHHARALLFPTFAEGFGIPLVEALSLGTPAIVSDLPVFREIAADIPEYMGPLDGAGWRRMILDYASRDSQRRAAQLARIQGYAPPSWEAHFAKAGPLIGIGTAGI